MSFLASWISAWNVLWYVPRISQKFHGLNLLLSFKSFLFFSFTSQRHIPWLWYASLHYLEPLGSPRFRKCWSHQAIPPPALNPSLLQLSCKEALKPISDFHVWRPKEMARSSPSAIRECKESPSLLMTVNLRCCSIFIPRQILVKDVFQLVGSFDSCSLKPVLPPT